MPKKLDITGERFGRWEVISEVEPLIRVSENGKLRSDRRYLCRCDCGTSKIVKMKDLRYGNSKSCGCYRRECVSQRQKIHGMTNTRLFNIWESMKERCSKNTNPKNTKNYASKGIEVCEEWKNDFLTFYKWAMNNGYSENLTIDRIDVNGNYEPSNCRWVDYYVQNNNSSNNRMIEYDGKSQTMSQWAKEYGVNYNTLESRLRNGWSMEKALRKEKFDRKRCFHNECNRTINT